MQRKLLLLSIIVIAVTSWATVYCGVIMQNTPFTFTGIFAAAGRTQSQIELAEMFEAEANVLTKNSEPQYVKNMREAEKWYLRAAELGNADAQFVLGDRFNFGCNKIKWLKKAAEQGHIEAQFVLGGLELQVFNCSGFSVERARQAWILHEQTL